MQTETKLTRAERIRLEALAQAVAAFGSRATTARELMDPAEEFEAWLYKADDHTTRDSEAKDKTENKSPDAREEEARDRAAADHPSHEKEDESPRDDQKTDEPPWDAEHHRPVAP